MRRACPSELGVRLLLKREDLTHTGSHKINNVIGQGLLTLAMGKPRVIAETGAGQHGVATATAAALFGLECVVYMGEVDTVRQELNVFRMRLLGAEVRPVSSGSRTLKDAVNEALRDWVASVADTHYCLGSVMGPHPYPWMVRELQRIVGDEARVQCRALLGGTDPDLVVACVGGGSNAAGTFAGFVDTEAAAGRRRGRRGLGHRAGRAGGAPRDAFLPAPGRVGPDPRGPVHLRRASTTRGSAPSTPTCRTRAGPLRHGVRRRGARRLAVAGPDRGHHPRPGAGPRPGLADPGGPVGRGGPGSTTVMLTLSGRGDKDAEQVMGLLT